MPEKYDDLKYRRRLSTSVDNGLMDGFEELANDLMCPKNWIMNEAIEDLLKKHKIKYEKTSPMYQKKEKNSKKK